MFTLETGTRERGCFRRCRISTQRGPDGRFERKPRPSSEGIPGHARLRGVEPSRLSRGLKQRPGTLSHRIYPSTSSTSSTAIVPDGVAQIRHRLAGDEVVGAGVHLAGADASDELDTAGRKFVKIRGRRGSLRYVADRTGRLAVELVTSGSMRTRSVGSDGPWVRTSMPSASRPTPIGPIASMVRSHRRRHSTRWRHHGRGGATHRVSAGRRKRFMWVRPTRQV